VPPVSEPAVFAPVLVPEVIMRLPPDVAVTVAATLAEEKAALRRLAQLALPATPVGKVDAANSFFALSPLVASITSVLLVPVVDEVISSWVPVDVTVAPVTEIPEAHAVRPAASVVPGTMVVEHPNSASALAPLPDVVIDTVLLVPVVPEVMTRLPLGAVTVSLPLVAA